MDIRLRPLDLLRDRPMLAGLWTSALDPRWPLLSRGLDMMRAGYVAEIEGVMVGMVGIDDLGSIPLVMVSPEWQRHGIGRKLVEAALAWLRQAGVNTVGLGSGGGRYIWPGVPQDLPGAVAFFERTGWAFKRVSVDLVRDLSDYQTPRDVWERIDPLRLTIETVGAGGRGAVMAFEDRYFPRWSRWFQEPGSQILAASTARDGVVASLLLDGPESASVFAPMLGTDMGTIGCVGVAEEHQGRGIGTALVAKASDLLRARRVRHCHISWTERERFYSRLGYRRWRVFLMCRRSLN